VLIAPITAGNPEHRLVTLGLATVVFAIAVWAMWRTPAIRYIATALATLASSALALDAFDPGHPALRALLVFSSLFFALTIARVLQRVLELPRVTEDSFYGAGSIYLLIGLAWSTVYYVIWKAVPSAFFFDTTHTHAATGWPDFVYFSFTTLATVGFGDITPVLPLVRSMVVLEVITGVFFVAIIIARLVSSYRLR
jgi:ion channel